MIILKFCVMNKPLENHPKVAMKENLKETTLKNTYEIHENLS